MSVRFARPDVSNLVFCLYERSIHPELFHTFASSSIQRPDFSAEVCVCEAGHVVTVRYAGTTVTEVMTTSEQALPRRKRMLHKRLRGSRNEFFSFDCGLRYHVSYHLEQLDPEVFLNIHEELLVDCGRVAVAHRFPAGNRLSPDALSLIRTGISAKTLSIHTYHTFPESYSVIKTQSLFEF